MVACINARARSIAERRPAEVAVAGAAQQVGAVAASVKAIRARHLRAVLRCQRASEEVNAREASRTVPSVDLVARHKTKEALGGVEPKVTQDSQHVQIRSFANPTPHKQ